MAMDKLMDREVHPYLKTAMDPCWYQIRDARAIPYAAMKKVANSNLNQRMYLKKILLSHL